MTDVVARLSGPLLRGSDSPAPIGWWPGGSAANTAAWLARDGREVTFVGRVGTDPAGDAAIGALIEAGVRPYVARDVDRPTGTCIVVVSPGGERSMIPDPGANAALDVDDIPLELFDATTHLHLSGYPLFNEGSRAAALKALALARAAGSSVSIDPSSAGPLAAAGPQRFLSWVGGCDALLANADEAMALTGMSDPADAARTLTAAFTEVVVTLGARGALWAGRGSTDVVRVDATPVDVLDTTGAGDAFAAGWLPQALDGASPATALDAGTALAAQAVAQVGARPGRASR
jgi:sugar/nucleoside kinase (ribokinase family)